MLDLSVIVPIYNTPLDMLDRCLRSIHSLEGCSFEALLIDDGSAAPVGAYCREYTAKNPAFRYIYKENGGVSSARNMGLAEARGRYVTFLDADDVILGETLVLQLTEAETADMIVFDMVLAQRDSDIVWRAFDGQSGTITRQQMLYQLMTSSSISGPCAKLYKKEILADIRFNTEFISGEDWMFVCDCALQAERFYYCAQATYRYFREESTGRSRVARFPDKMLSNQLARYDRKQQLLELAYWTTDMADQIRSLAAAELIENLFNMSAEMLLAKQDNTERRDRIRNAVTEAGQLLKEPVSKKTKLKQWVITRCPAALGVLALFRNLYLKLKK